VVDLDTGHVPAVTDVEAFATIVNRALSATDP